jgi:Large ribosomal RNA subunit accumulation protein YceD
MNPADPWRVPVVVGQIPDTGLHRAFEASEAARAAIADIAGLREIMSASASFDLKLKSGGRVHVSGEVRARIGQTCVVTLDPIENEIDEVVDLIFAPSEQITALSATVDEAAQKENEEVPEPPEPIINGVIDVGRLATDVLFLAIDPYPRRHDVVFEPLQETVDPADHPFAALKALQTGGTPTSAKKDPKNPGDGKDR